MKVAKAKGSAARRQPKLRPNRAKHLFELHDSDSYTKPSSPELFGVTRSTIYPTIERMPPQPVEPERPFAHVLPPFRNTEISTPPFTAKG
jgi:hypothetical protein